MPEGWGGYVDQSDVGGVSVYGGDEAEASGCDVELMGRSFRNFKVLVPYSAEIRPDIYSNLAEAFSVCSGSARTPGFPFRSFRCRWLPQTPVRSLLLPSNVALVTIARNRPEMALYHRSRLLNS